MDYRILNSRTRTPQEPIPRKEDILNAMQGCQWFSCMDLLSGYYQQLIRESDRKFTAFSTPSGHYEYIVTAQGLCGAPASFNRWVQHIFADLQLISREFFDDIYVMTRSPSLQKHLEALDQVLKRCEESGLSIKLSKCVFAATEIPVLGDFVGRKGVRMDPDKVAIIRGWPTPKTKKQLKSFLGTIVYCARFCKDYGKLVAPLQDAIAGKTKNEPIQLTGDQFAAFNGLKEAMSSTPVLSLPDFSKQFGIRMDASDYAIGGVLYQCDERQEEHPVAFTGRKLNRAELKYPVREKELLAVMHALKTWRPYLLDKPFTVETDHKSLQELLTQRTCTQRLARWLNLLSQFRPEFKWIPGITNDTADGLSRRHDLNSADRPASSVDLKQLLQSIIDGEDPLGEEVDDESQYVAFADYDQARTVYYTMTMHDIPSLCKAGYAADPQFSSIWKYLLEGGQDNDDLVKYFQYENGLLWYSKVKDEPLRLCIPNNPELRRRCLFSEHDDPSKGHPGQYKTCRFLERKYYWKNMRAFVRKYVQSCEKCQRNKYRQTKPPGHLNPLPIPESRWQHITMDFILELPESNSFNALWIIVDRLTKRAHFIPVFMGDNESSARACAVIFCKEYQRLHGIPESIVSDRDTRFTSEFWKELMTLQGTQQNLSSAFKPSTDGQTERTNRFFEDYVRNYVHANQSNWSDLVFCAEIAYNSRVHSSINMSPFEADIGYIPRSVPDHCFDRVVGNKSKRDAYEFGRKQQEILIQLKQSLLAAQERMKRYYDRNRPVQVFEVGDQVMISSKNLNIEHLGVVASSSRKFAPLWIGPYLVAAKTSIDTYKLSLPVGLRLHPEFHTSLLKPYFVDSDPRRLNKPNEGMVAAGGFEDGFLVERILDHKRSKGKIFFKVKWVGYPSDHNSWEPLDNFIKPATVLIKQYLAQRHRDWNTWTSSTERRRR